MSIRKQGRFEVLRYDGTSKFPVLEFKGEVLANDNHYVVFVSQGSDGSVAMNLAPNGGGYFSFLSCPKGLIGIVDDRKKYLSKPQFLENAGMSDSDVSGLVKILRRESKALFGSSAEYMQPCLNKMRSNPFVSELRSVLHKKLEPLFEKLKLSRDDRERVYNAALSSYYQLERRI